jgi:photosystem II stability/assembly factor-like uncharacterized protein
VNPPASAIAWVIVSDDGGETWQDRAAGLPPGTPALALVQLDGQTLLAGTQTGIYLSRDGGQSWKTASAGLGVPQVHTLVLEPQTGSLVVATETGLYRSDPNGKFDRIGSPEMQAPILSVAIAPDRPQTIYAGGFRRGIFVSDDAGTQWSQAGDIFAGRLSPTGLAVDPANASNVFARVLYERIYKSSDGARTWHSVWTGMPDDAEVETMSIDASDPRNIDAGTNNGLYVSSDAGESWTRRGLDGRTVLAVWIDPQNPKTILAGATDGLYRSVDAGAIWTPIALENVTVSAIASGANGALYAGTRYGGVWSSVDGGRTWKWFSDGMDGENVITLVVDDARNRVYAATSLGIFRAPAIGQRLPP